MKNVKGIVVWQSEVCLHRYRVFDILSKKYPVIYAYMRREFRNYNEVSVDNLDLVHLQTKNDVDEIISRTRDWIHINNSFIRTPENELIYYALHKIRDNCRCFGALFQEQYPHWSDNPKNLLRRLKWALFYNLGYGSKLKFIGCTGDSANLALRRALVNKNKLFEFIYTPPYLSANLLGDKFIENKCVEFVMVGQIVDRKSVLEVVRTFNTIEENYKLTIIGTGNQKEQLIELIKGNDKINYIESLNPNEVQEIMTKSDYLIIASKFDGWGCTTNEGLMNGCKVIASDRTGSHSLIKNRSDLGVVFQYNDWNNFKQIVLSAIEKGPLSVDEQRAIFDWAKCITPEVEAEYFEGVLQHYFFGQPLPRAPWK